MQDKPGIQYTLLQQQMTRSYGRAHTENPGEIAHGIYGHCSAFTSPSTYNTSLLKPRIEFIGAIGQDELVCWKCWIEKQVYGSERASRPHSLASDDGRRRRDTTASAAGAKTSL